MLKRAEQYQPAAGAAGGSFYDARDLAAAPVTASSNGYRPGQAGSDKGESLEKAQQAVHTVGSKTFYRQAGRWIDAALSKDQEKNAVRVERFSENYFKFIDKHGNDVAKYLNFDEPVVVENPPPDTLLSAYLPGGVIPRGTKIIRLELLTRSWVTFLQPSYGRMTPLTIDRLGADVGINALGSVKGTLAECKFLSAAPGTRVRLTCMNW